MSHGPVPGPMACPTAVRPIQGKDSTLNAQRGKEQGKGSTLNAQRMRPPKFPWITTSMPHLATKTQEKTLIFLGAPRGCGLSVPWTSALRVDGVRCSVHHVFYNCLRLAITMDMAMPHGHIHGQGRKDQSKNQPVQEPMKLT